MRLIPPPDVTTSNLKVGQHRDHSSFGKELWSLLIYLLVNPWASPPSSSQDSISAESPPHAYFES